MDIYTERKNRYAQNLEPFNFDAFLQNISLSKDKVEDDIYTYIPQKDFLLISEKVIDLLTNIRAIKQEELDAHNELLNNCAKGIVSAQQQVQALINKILAEEQLVDAPYIPMATNKIFKDYYGLGAIEDLFRDPKISEIWVNGYDQVWIDHSGVKQKIQTKFKNNTDVERVINLLILFDKKHISPTNPRVECRLSDGSRLTCMIPPCAAKPYINIRKFSSFAINTENYLENGTFNEEMADCLQKLTKGRANMVISGETNSGKTTLLKYIVQFINPLYRIGVIESHFELKVDETYPDRNIVCFEVHEEAPIRVTMKDLFVSMLRFSPDIIIVGEARSSEAEEMIKAMRRGHQGSIGTIHSSSPEMAVADIMDMINEDGRTRNSEMLLKKVTNSVDIVIQIRRFADGKRRITNISEINAKEETSLNFSYEIRHLWEWVVDYTREDQGYFNRTDRASTKLKTKLHYYGLSLEETESL